MPHSNGTCWKCIEPTSLRSACWPCFFLVNFGSPMPSYVTIFLSLISIVQVTWRQSTRLLGVPLKPKNYHILFQCPDSFLKFLQAVRDSGSLDEDVGPPVVHCSAGIGRSGTFCLVDSCLVLVSHFFLFCARRFSCSVHVEPILIQTRLSVCQQWSTSLWDLT